MNTNKKTIILIVLLLLFITGLVLWGRQREGVSTERELSEAEKDALLDKAAKELQELMKPLPYDSEDETIEGITIEKKGNKKIIKNEAQGFTIEIPADLVLTGTRGNVSIEFHDPEMVKEAGIPRLSVVIGITVNENKEKLSLEQYINELSIKEGEEDKEEIIINGEKGYKIYTEPTERIPGNYAYFFIRDYRIYIIVLFTDDESIIRSFKFE